jgi:Raf kinase inhibitor-like YbhB/YbcL family protein
MARPLFIADLAVSSPDIADGGRFPDRFTLYADNDTPTIVIDGIPEGTVEVALICHDPDAPRARGFTHWVVYGIPPRSGVEVGPSTVTQFRVAENDRGEARWMGPRPPAGHGTHRYYFWAYALSRAVEDLPSRAEFLAEYAEDIIEQNRMVVTYDRAPEA